MAKEKTLEEIIRELYHVSGYRISIYNSKQEEVCAWPKKLQLFCQMVQVNPVCLRQCRVNDDNVFIKARQTGEVVIYRCHMGLYEAVAPLYDRGRLSGYLMMQKDITLDELRHMFYCSRATLTNSFRKTYVTSIHQYLTAIRLKAGCEMLADEGCTVGQAARESGFQDQNYFTKVFKKEYGVTPSNYRKTITDRRSR